MSTNPLSLALTIVGTAAGAYLGGPMGALQGAMLGNAIGGAVNPPTLPGQISEGPRLQDLKVQTSSYGKPIPIILGKMRTAGNLLWIKTGGLIEQRVEQTSNSGGGKTGGGASSTQIYYEYYATFAVAVCKGPIKAILKVWADSKLVYNAEATDAGTQTANARFLEWAHGYLGDESQVADSVIEADLGAGNVPGYRGQAYVVFENFPLKDYGNRIPNFTFEVMALVPTGSGSSEASQYVEVSVNQVLDSTIKLALNFNGTDGANADADFKDSSRYNKPLQVSTSDAIAELDTAQKVFGLSSGLFQYQNSFVYTGVDDDFNLSATAPWQISWRYRTQNVSAKHCLVCKRTGIAGSGEPSAASWNINIGNGVLQWGSDGNGNKTAYLDAAPAFNNNTWTAFRISHDGNGNLRFYKGGQILYSGAGLTGQTYQTISAFTGYNQINIGNIFLTGQPDTDIWIDDFVIQKGGNVTVADSYTVETTETGPATVTRTQATGGIVEFPDHSGNNRSPVSVTGSPIGTSAQKVFGAASALFAPGSAINYHNADWQGLQNSGTWGIGFRIRFKDSIASAVILSTGGVDSDGWQLEYDHSLTSIYNGNITTNCRTIKFTHSSGTVLRWAFVLGVSRTDPVADTWYTLGLSYASGYMRLYVNGVYQPSTKVALGSITNNSGSVFRIGQGDGGTVSYYLDELIIQDTSGIYSADSDYVVPTSAFTADTNTRLLLHFDEIFTAVGASTWGSGLAYVDTRVSNIIAWLCTQAGLTDFNTDYIALNDNAIVPGFIMNNVAPVRQALEMLAAAFLIDVVESTTTLYFVSRNSLINGGPAAIIPEDDLGARHVTQSPGIPLDITTQQEVEIPKELAVRYLDANRDYYEASQRSLKQQTSSIGRVELNLSALSLTDSQAKIAAIGNHMFAWAERKKYKFTLPLKYAWLDCGDLVQIDYSSQSHFVRIIKMNYGAGYFDVEGVGQDFTGINFDTQADGYAGPISTGIFTEIPANTQALVVSSTTTVGASGTPAPATINYPVVSILLLLDMAIISDSEDGEGYYIGIDKGASANYWPGASVYKSSDGASFATLLGLASALTTGQAINALASGPTELWDMANTVTIALTNGTLASDTEANVLNGANIGILGVEIIQWTTATLDGNGYYVLSGLLRGRRGTEWAKGTHVAGERFILFNASALVRTAGIPEEIGLQRIYRAVTVGLNLADQTSQNFTNTAKGLKPYAPVHIAGSRDGSNNLTITWIRRTRTGGSWRDNVDASLGETAEQYAVDIMSGATVLRTITGLTSATTSYTAAEQTADGRTPGDPVSVNIYQISSVVGRGYAGSGTI